MFDKIAQKLGRSKPVKSHKSMAKSGSSSKLKSSKPQAPKALSTKRGAAPSAKKQAITFDERFKQSKEDEAKIVSSLLSLTEDEKTLICFTDNGYVWINNNNVNDRKVLGFIQEAKINGIKCVVKVVCTLTQLRQVYDSLDSIDVNEHKKDGSDSSRGNVSQVQLDIMDFFKKAVKRNASDIHLISRVSTGEIELRILGDMIMVQEVPKDTLRAWCSTIYNSMCQQQDAAYRESTYQTAALASEFVRRIGLFGARVASSPSNHGPHMVIRLLYDNGGDIPSIPDLGYLPEQVELLETMMSNNHGLAIFSGETGSGKSTSLVSILAELGRRERVRGERLVSGLEEFHGISIQTIEDPIEYQIPYAVQTPLVVENRGDEESIATAWTQAISSFVRKDPDVLMVGEIRDPGSAKATIDAASTGVQGWSTLHTSDAVGCMIRLKGLSVGIDRLYNPEVVTGLVNQNLVQKLCPHCSVSWHDHKQFLSDKDRKIIEEYCDLDKIRFRGLGCSHCGDKKGIVGRLVIAEVIVPNINFMNVLQKEGAAAAKLYWIEHMGGITKTMALIRRINEGLVDPINGQSDVEPLDKDLVTLGIDSRLNKTNTRPVALTGAIDKEVNYA